MSLAVRFLAAATAFVAVTVSAFAAERWMEIPEPPAMPAAVSTGYADVNGIKMYYASTARARPCC